MKQITKSSSEEDENGGSKFRKMREKYSSKLFALGFRNDFSLLLKMSIPLVNIHSRIYIIIIII